MTSAKKLQFRHEKERLAIEWIKNHYGRDWRKHFSVPLAVQEKTFPYQNLRFHCARPFGRLDWNLHVQWARRCLVRNAFMR